MATSFNADNVTAGSDTFATVPPSQPMNTADSDGRTHSQRVTDMGDAIMELEEAVIDAAGGSSSLAAKIALYLPLTGGTLTSQSAAIVGLAIKGYTAQTADLFQAQNSSATVLAKIDAAGVITAASKSRFGNARILGDASSNIGIGSVALDSVSLTGAGNNAVGVTALRYNTTGNNNNAVGANALTNNTTGSSNNAVGTTALNSNTTGNENSALGYSALRYVTTGSGNIGVGIYAGTFSTTQDNEFFVNSLNRTNRAGDITKSIIYGVQNATAANQTLALNAAVTVLAGLTVNASTATVASLNIPHGTAPTSPVNGDVWTTTAGLFVRINGVTKGPLT